MDCPQRARDPAAQSPGAVKIMRGRHAAARRPSIARLLPSTAGREMDALGKAAGFEEAL
jgi:hypothetical protein